MDTEHESLIASFLCVLKFGEKEMPKSSEKREYITGLMKKRSVIALLSGVLEMICVFFALLMGFNAREAYERIRF